MDNAFLAHYRQHKISPVRQNLDDLDRHFGRRLGLYRQLGILPPLVTGRRVIEVGPGSGHNALVTARLAPSRYVLVEPNETGCQDIMETFASHGLDLSRIELVNSLLEQYQSDQGFDLILCEGLIPGLGNKMELLSHLDRLLNLNGVVVVTCADEISMFYEIVRIFFAHRLSRHLSSFPEKISLLSTVFEPHLKSIPGFGRLIGDWCSDSLFGGAHFNYDFSIKNCISFFSGLGYHYYHCSPDLFTEYTWYKAVPTGHQPFNELYIEQFDRIKHNLMLYTEVAPARPAARNEELLELCRAVMQLVQQSLKDDADRQDQPLIAALEGILENVSDLGEGFARPLRDIATLIRNREFSVQGVSTKYPAFAHAFGRGQQYVSLVKTGRG
ncbi:class I SAM-dependent methyltransferase [Citrifermentans bremense]|uniref:class I SAM-dependent methyltransferase n=1 Tax=Citrifermentans bremense TaxID=60035 RepID=UPI0003F8B3A8|nr:class I SAM-dependent methyltransferase [Citrifermentans bremense]